MSKRWRNGHHHHHYWRLCCFVAMSLLSLSNKQCRNLLLVAAGAPTSFTTTTSNTHPPQITSTDDDVVANNQTTSTSKFFDKFETYGPTLTLTLRDPSTTTLLGGGDRGRSKLWPLSRTDKHHNKEVTKIKPMQQEAAEDDGTFGLSSKLAAIFHITPTTYSQPSLSSSTTSSKFDDGYMLDDGEIFLDPPPGSSSKSRGLFSIREMGNSILKSNEWCTSWAQSVHPEMQFEMKTREQQSTTATGTANCDESNPNDVVHAVDTRPFPDTAPWLSGISCGMKWSPFPIYKAGYTGDGYGHKLMSIPHYIRCGAKISLPRISSMIRQSLKQSTSGGSGDNIGCVFGKS